MSKLKPVVEDPGLSVKIENLISSGAAWGESKEVNEDLTVHVLSNVHYADESPLQSLDLYFPDELLSKSPEKKLPIYIHIHGGGWSRGAKDSPFYGGPSMSQNAASSGCIAVAPGYRLGKYPEFMLDAAMAIRWVKDNIAEFGGDLSKIFLSGHSAGGHIASLLLVRHSTFLAPMEIPLDFFIGLVLASGVYDLFQPLRKAPLDAKNKWFFVAYVLPAFGNDDVLRREASPLLLLEPEKETSNLGTLASLITKTWAAQTSGKDADDDKDSASCTVDDTTTPVPFDINTSHLPSTLIMNATFDMGLEENGELMADAMSKYTDVKYVRVPGTDHASICWNEQSTSAIREFIHAHCVVGS